jgi:hypothetical protein
MNPRWLQENEFNEIFKEVWKDTIYQTEPGIQHCLVWKLKTLKICIKHWAQLHRKLNLTILKEMELNIHALPLEDNLDGGH